MHTSKELAKGSLWAQASCLSILSGLLDKHMYSITQVVLWGSPNIQKGLANMPKENTLIAGGCGTLSSFISFLLIFHSIPFWNIELELTVFLCYFPLLTWVSWNISFFLFFFWRRQFLRLANLGRLTLPPWGREHLPVFLNEVLETQTESLKQLGCPLIAEKSLVCMPVKCIRIVSAKSIYVPIMSRKFAFSVHG